MSSRAKTKGTSGYAGLSVFWLRRRNGKDSSLKR
jgi:hypothetical protein